MDDAMNLVQTQRIKEFLKIIEIGNLTFCSIVNLTKFNVFANEVFTQPS